MNSFSRRAQYLVIGEADHGDSLFFESVLAQGIVGPDFGFLMNLSIDFNGEFACRAVEINDVLPERSLPQKT